MALGTTLVQDFTPNVVGASIQALSTNDLKTAYPGKVYVSSKHFTINVHGLHIGFTKGVPQVLDAAMLAACTAAGAPISAA